MGGDGWQGRSRQGEPGDSLGKLFLVSSELNSSMLISRNPPRRVTTCTSSGRPRRRLSRWFLSISATPGEEAAAELCPFLGVAWYGPTVFLSGRQFANYAVQAIQLPANDLTSSQLQSVRRDYMKLNRSHVVKKERIRELFVEYFNSRFE